MLYAGGKVLRDYTYVDDVVAVIILSAINPNAYGQLYNIGGYAASIADFAQ